MKMSQWYQFWGIWSDYLSTTSTDQIWWWRNSFYTFFQLGKMLFCNILIFHFCYYCLYGSIFSLSAGLIFLFYLIFYTCLAGMFALTMYVMLQTLDEHRPTWQDRLSTPGAETIDTSCMNTDHGLCTVSCTPCCLSCHSQAWWLDLGQMTPLK